MYVAGGIPFLGQRVDAASVLYLQLDTSETVWRQRLKDLRTAGVSLPPNLHFVHPEDQPTRCNILSTPTQEFFIEALAACNPALVVLDVLREAHNAEENDSSAMKLVGDMLMTIFRGRTLLLIHHTHKLYESYGKPNPINAARGSSYITGKADAIWLLHAGELAIASRFHHDERRPCSRLDNGLWHVGS
jgi:hypothetical protein